MIKRLLVLSLLFTHSLSATEINHAIGFGLQYAGVAGYQISTKNDAHRFRGGLGYLGMVQCRLCILVSHFFNSLTIFLFYKER